MFSNQQQALLEARVLTSLALEGFFMDVSLVVGPPGETDETPQATLDEMNQKFAKVDDVMLKKLRSNIMKVFQYKALDQEVTMYTRTKQG